MTIIVSLEVEIKLHEVNKLNDFAPQCHKFMFIGDLKEWFFFF